MRKILPDDVATLNAGMAESARTLQPHHHEFRLRRANGTIAWLRGDSVPERMLDGGVLWHGFITDITESRRIENKLVESAKLESLGVLAGGIAHDFNNLLTGILGNASLARLELPPSSLGQPMLDQIEMAARRAADLCKQMLAYSGKGRFVVQRLDVNRIIEDTTHLLQISIAKNCVLRFNLAPDLPAVMADATQLRQVVMNLVINASEAIGSRSGVLALTTGVARVDEEYLRGFRLDASPAPGDYVYIEVSDNGCGMDATTLSKMFDPFFTTKFTGRGLGLAAVLGIVRGHKGGLKVYSEAGRGTTFKLFFPVATGKAQDSASPFPFTANFKGSGTVLIADDEETVRTVAARLLERLGFDVVLAMDGREAIEIFRAEPARFAFVLLDLTMPHIDGEETFRQLRQIRPDVRVLLTSGFNQQEAVTRFTGKGLAGFIQKPFELTKLTQVVRSVLGDA
jgi:signal transduction histidine kinase/CheY-like chemotaxis protein